MWGQCILSGGEFSILSPILNIHHFHQSIYLSLWIVFSKNPSLKKKKPISKKNSSHPMDTNRCSPRYLKAHSLPAVPWWPRQFNRKRVHHYRFLLDIYFFLEMVFFLEMGFFFSLYVIMEKHTVISFLFYLFFLF